MCNRMSQRELAYSLLIGSGSITQTGMRKYFPCALNNAIGVSNLEIKQAHWFFLNRRNKVEAEAFRWVENCVCIGGEVQIRRILSMLAGILVKID